MTTLKKGLSLFLALVMVMCVLNVSVFAATDEYVMPDNVAVIIKKMQNLDADKDGSYTTGDVSAVLKAAAGIVESDDYSCYDINGDDYVSIADAKATLDAVTGITPVVTDEEILTVFNERSNSVKGTLPGFKKTETVDCSSILITTKNAPVSDLNVTNLEYDKYVSKLVKVMNSFPYNLALNDEMRAELKKMEASAKAAYEPQTRKKTILSGAAWMNDHYSIYPISGFMDSSRLKYDDVKTISYDMINGSIKIDITMGNYSYSGSQYPDSIDLAGKIKLPYGRVFNLPTFDSDEGTVEKIDLKNGKISLKFDYLDCHVEESDYSYNYTASVKAAKDPDSDLEMTTTTSASFTEEYKVGR